MERGILLKYQISLPLAPLPGRANLEVKEWGEFTHNSECDMIKFSLIFEHKSKNDSTYSFSASLTK